MHMETTLSVSRLHRYIHVQCATLINNVMMRFMCIKWCFQCKPTQSPPAVPILVTHSNTQFVLFLSAHPWCRVSCRYFRTGFSSTNNLIPSILSSTSHAYPTCPFPIQVHSSYSITWLICLFWLTMTGSAFVGASLIKSCYECMYGWSVTAIYHINTRYHIAHSTNLIMLIMALSGLDLHRPVVIYGPELWSSVYYVSQNMVIYILY